MQVLSISALGIVLAGCGPSSWEKRQAEHMAERERRKVERDKSEQSIRATYGCEIFPTGEAAIGAAAPATIELQRQLFGGGSKTFGFKAYIEDVYQEGDNVFADFVCPVNGGFASADSPCVNLRLVVTAEDVPELLDLRRQKEQFFMGSPNLYVIADVEQLRRQKVVLVDGYPEGEADVVLEYGWRFHWKVVGTLRKTIPMIPDY